MEHNPSVASEFDLRIPINSSQNEEDIELDIDISYIAWSVFVTSILTAWLGTLLFYGQSLGINLSIYILIFVGGGVVLPWWYQRHIELKHAIFALPAILFSVLTAWTTNSFLQLLNILIVIAALFILLRFISNKLFLGGHWRVSVIASLNMMMLGWIEAPILVISQSRRRMRHVELEGTQLHAMLSVVRGCFFAVPVLAVFGVLLASADVVLQAELDDFFDAVIPSSIGDIVGQSFLMFFLTWVALTVYKTMLFANVANRLDTWQPTPTKKNPWQWINMIEAGIVLGSVILLFVVVVLIQARYLLGGGANIADYGYTYSEYARRGFFEIVIVSFMTMTLVVSLHIITQRNTMRQENYFRGLSISLILLTLILLVAAFERLGIYVEAYGFTRLRLETRIFMIWLSMLFGVLIFDLFKLQLKWFWVACIVVSLGYVLTLNIMNEDRFIANANIARFERNGKLDVDYLLSLSDDVIPVIAPLLDNTDLAENKRDTLKIGLGQRLYELNNYHENRSWVEYHYRKAKAWQALDDYRSDLADYIVPPIRWQDNIIDGTPSQDSTHEP